MAQKVLLHGTKQQQKELKMKKEVMIEENGIIELKKGGRKKRTTGFSH